MLIAFDPLFIDYYTMLLIMGGLLLGLACGT